MIEQVTSTGPDGAVQVSYSDGRMPVATSTELPPDTAMREELHAWLDAGGAVSSRPPQPATMGDYRFAIQAHIDATAQARNYDSGLTCASYTGSTNPAWAAEATAFVAWRDDVWTYAYSEFAKVQAGERPQPSIAEIIGDLPVMTWPA